MYDKFQVIIGHLIGQRDTNESLIGLKISNIFRPNEDSDLSVARNINSAFLICLAGETHQLYHEAKEYLSKMQQHTFLGYVASFFLKGLSAIHNELSIICSNNSATRKKLDDLSAYLKTDISNSHQKDIIDKVHSFFFPEGVSVLKDIPKMIDDLRSKRTITHLQLNPDPIENPFREILFTSNILLSTPPHSKDIDSLFLEEPIRTKLRDIIKEDQLFWYDHPIQIGANRESNEILYGLKGLENAVKYELAHKSISKNEKINCVLSVSVTHNGLCSIVKEYIEDVLKSCTEFHHLNVYIFTEEETKRLNDEILIPAAKRYFSQKDSTIFHEIVGVDGEYSRHYSFLKAIAAFWNVFIDPTIKGTFKIDLDQVFPQNELIKYTGTSAFDHFRSPLWGAKGIDNNGKNVELGMIAGALVNEKDVEKSLFTPDVDFPTDNIDMDEWVFFSHLTHALSTHAEMMTRYNNEKIDGKKSCLQRIHVTGGTNGIFVSSLRRYHPFTPSFVGRAEDQAYIMSVLFEEKNNTLLRYVHKDGLIMRHDKETFAKEAINSMKIENITGDYARILWFSYYARALPWPVKRIKEILDPFSGCFISSIPFTTVYLRLSLKAASFFSGNNQKMHKKGLRLLETSTKRLDKIITYLHREQNPLIEQYQREKEGWDLYYNILDKVELELNKGDSFAQELKKKAVNLLNDCKMKL